MLSDAKQEYGARPLRRAVTATLEDALADAMLRGTLQSGDSVLAKLSAAAAAEAAAGRAPLMGPAAVRACSTRPFTAPLRTLHDLNCPAHVHQPQRVEAMPAYSPNGQD